MFSFLFDFVRSVPVTKRLICCDAPCAMSILQSRSFRYKHLPSILIQTWIFGLCARAPPCSPFSGDWRLVWLLLVSTESKLIRSRGEHARSAFAWRLAQSPG